MKKGFILSLMFVIVLVLSVGFVESQNIKLEAKAAGYHNVLYTNGISNLNPSSPWVSILSDNLVVGSNPTDTLWIYNDPYYGEFVLETSFGTPITVVNDFRVYSTLKAYSYVQAFAYCDIYGANCLNNGQLVNRLNGFYTNISRLQTNVTTLNNRVDNLQTDVTALQTASNVWTQSGANAYYTSTGNVGIGVNPPTTKLDVNGNIKSTSINTGNIVSSGSVTSVSGVVSGSISAGSVSAGSVSSSGSVSAGSILSSGSVSAGSVSAGSVSSSGSVSAGSILSSGSVSAGSVSAGSVSSSGSVSAGSILSSGSVSAGSVSSSGSVSAGSVSSSGVVSSSTQMNAPRFCDMNGNNCLSLSSGTVTVSSSNYCTQNFNIDSSRTSVNYVTIGPTTRVYGTIAFNLDASKPSLCAVLSGLPKNFPETVRVRGFATGYDSYQSSSWVGRVGMAQMTRYNNENLLAFRLDNSAQFVDGAASSLAGWYAYIDFVY
jgi:outer membrane murein-binding lipoprotein Lpp